MSSLLTPRQLISTLITSISSSNQQYSPNPLKNAPPATQKSLLTLHVLFPNELLPALDLLDRNSITRLTVRKHAHVQPQQREPPNPQPYHDLQPGPPPDPQGHHSRPSLSPPRHGPGSDSPLLPEQLAVRPDRLRSLQQELPSHSTSRPFSTLPGQVQQDAHHSSLRSPQDRYPRPSEPHPQSHSRHPPIPQISAPHSPNPHPHGPTPSLHGPPPQDSHRQEEGPARPPPEQAHLTDRRDAHHARAGVGVSSSDALHGVYHCRSARGGPEARNPALRYGDFRVGGREVRVVSAEGGREREVKELGSGYEVRLDAWNCSCPAFAFKIVNSVMQNASERDHQRPDESTLPMGSKQWSFGGLGMGSEVPVCKHLLACALVENCELFKGMVEQQEISIEELAGLAAGWAD